MNLSRGSVCLYADGAQNLASFDRGIPRYIVEHVRAIQAAQPSLIGSILLNPNLPVTGNLSWLIETGLLGWNASDRRILGEAARRSPRVYHVMSPFELGTPLDLMWPSWARDPRTATVVTLYDLIPLVFAEQYLSGPHAHARVPYETRLNLIRHADQVLAISQTTADDAVSHLQVPEDRVHVINAGASEHFARMYESPEPAWKELAHGLGSVRRGFILYVSGIEFRKNHDRLITGYARLPPRVRSEHQLVIACRVSQEQVGAIREHADRVGVGTDDLVLTGYVTDAQLGALYHTCDLFVFPSLYEGSGLPMLEAMSCGAPVAASSTSTSPEILGNLDATFDPLSPDSIAGCIGQVIDSAETIERLRERSRRRVTEYTWTQVAERTIEAYDQAAGPGLKRRFRRPRIALVTPWLPEQSGISTYNLRLAGELGGRVDADIVVAGSVEEYPAPLEYGIRLMSTRDFSRLRPLRQYDRIVYCMGGSRYHGHVYELLRSRPGVLILHDAQFTGFYGWYAGQERPEDPVGRLTERIQAMYSDRLPPDAVQGGPPDWDRQLALGIYMTRELQSLAEECFVHSEFARGILKIDREPLARHVPISLLPFGMPTPTTAPRAAASPSPLVVSLGVVHEIKGLATLISAFGLLAKDIPNARLVIAGTTAPEQLQRWEAYVHRNAPHAAIELLGYVAAERYSELLRTADLAVQLRLASNGEASAAVADCLSYGLPTVVTDLGWAGELPDVAVSKVPLGVEPAQLKERMLSLLAEPAQRLSLAEAALEYAQEYSFARVAEAYVEALGLV